MQHLEHNESGHPKSNEQNLKIDAVIVRVVFKTFGKKITII